MFPYAGVEIHRGCDIYVPACNDGVREHLSRIGEEPVKAKLEQLPESVTKFAVFTDSIGTEDSRSQAIHRYIASVWGEKYEPVISGGIVDVAARGVTKGEGVKYLLKALNISREHLYCAGDGWNDLPMMEIARMSFAPADANPAVFASGARRVCTAREGAVAEIIDILDGIY